MMGLVAMPGTMTEIQAAPAGLATAMQCIHGRVMVYVTQELDIFAENGRVDVNKAYWEVASLEPGQIL